MESWLAKSDLPARPRRSSASRTKVKTIMTREVVQVPVDEDLDSLARLMLDRGLSRVPVIGPNGELCGIVSKTDLVRDHQRSPPASRADRVMASPVLSLSDECTVIEAARLMALQAVHGAPVLSSTGKLVGWLSALDILSWLSGLR